MQVLRHPRIPGVVSSWGHFLSNLKTNISLHPGSRCLVLKSWHLRNLTLPTTWATYSSPPAPAFFALRDPRINPWLVVYTPPRTRTNLQEIELPASAHCEGQNALLASRGWAFCPSSLSPVGLFFLDRKSVPHSLGQRLMAVARASRQGYSTKGRVVGPWR